MLDNVNEVDVREMIFDLEPTPPSAFWDRLGDIEALLSSILECPKFICGDKLLNPHDVAGAIDRFEPKKATLEHFFWQCCVNSKAL
jgi:hypothetical protein